MIKRHVTLQELKAAVDACVEERGADYVYHAPGEHSDMGGSCLYWHDHENQPGCIVGLALHKLGADEAFLSGHEGNTSIGMLKLLVDDYGWTFEQYESADHWLNEIQCRQDKGMAWGDAVNLKNEGYLND